VRGWHFEVCTLHPATPTPTAGPKPPGQSLPWPMRSFFLPLNS